MRLLHHLADFNNPFHLFMEFKLRGVAIGGQRNAAHHIHFRSAPRAKPELRKEGTRRNTQKVN